MKKTALVFLLFLCASFTMLAQRTVTGVITEANGDALIGASVLAKGTDAGTSTDIDGSFRLEVPAGADVLVVSYTGFETQEVALGASSTITIVLQEGKILDEVVVTALGIEKQSKDLGYSIDEVGSEELVKARETNIVNALQGKVTGVQVSNTGGNLGGSSKIIIRGATSLSGRNNPLWVIDGMPFNDNQFVTGSRISGNRDFGNGASVVNPDDIESISILKGAAATALYGSRAASGAIIVTTKKEKLVKMEMHE